MGTSIVVVVANSIPNWGNSIFSITGSGKQNMNNKGRNSQFYNSCNIWDTLWRFF